MKGVYVIFFDLKTINGINKKVIGQYNAFVNAGFDMHYYRLDSSNSFICKLLSRFPFINYLPRMCFYEREFENVDFVYMRRPPYFSYQYLQFLKKIRQKNRKCRIIVEIPTYPYDKEMIKPVKNIPFYIKDIVMRPFLHNYINYISYQGKEKKLFKIPTVLIKNGYDFDKINFLNTNVEKKSFDICCTAMFMFWHGYERIINSLYNYYRNKYTQEIKLHFVGEGPELEHYKNLVIEKKLEKYVIFHGLKAQSELPMIYNYCDIGADVFGGYKKNFTYSCSLKTREYLASGLPIIAGSALDIQEYNDLAEFVYEFPNNNSEIDLNKILFFYEGLLGKYGTRIKLRSEIRNKANKHLNFTSSMENLINLLKDNEKQ